MSIFVHIHILKNKGIYPWHGTCYLGNDTKPGADSECREVGPPTAGLHGMIGITGTVVHRTGPQLTWFMFEITKTNVIHGSCRKSTKLWTSPVWRCLKLFQQYDLTQPMVLNGKMVKMPPFKTQLGGDSQNLPIETAAWFPNELEKQTPNEWLVGYSDPEKFLVNWIKWMILSGNPRPIFQSFQSKCLRQRWSNLNVWKPKTPLDGRVFGSAWFHLGITCQVVRSLPVRHQSCWWFEINMGINKQLQRSFRQWHLAIDWE